MADSFYYLGNEINNGGRCSQSVLASVRTKMGVIQEFIITVGNCI